MSKTSVSKVSVDSRKGIWLLKNPAYSKNNLGCLVFDLYHGILTKPDVLQKDKYRAHGTRHAGDSSWRTPRCETSIAVNGLRLTRCILITAQPRLRSHLAIIHQRVENRLDVFHSQWVLATYSITSY